MHGEARDFFSIVPRNLKNTIDLNDENTQDLLNGNQTDKFSFTLVSSSIQFLS